MREKHDKGKLRRRELSKFLASLEVDTSLINKLKIRYRPYVCPFGELLEYAKEAKSVFDIGCGSGQFCALIAEHTNAEKIKGIEIVNDLIINAKRIHACYEDKRSIDFSLFDGKTIPNDIVEYDVVYLIDVYHHIPIAIRDDLIEQIHNKMKKGAVLIFKDINAGSKLVLFNKVHDMFFAREFPHEISLDKANSILKRKGFLIRKSYQYRVLWFPHYFILAEKK